MEYGQVAGAVNQREMNRFTDTIRQKWNPKPHEQHYLYDGCTDEGAIADCVYEQAAFVWPESDGSRNDLTATELDNQVQLRAGLDEIMDYAPKPLTDPLPLNKQSELLSGLKAALRQQMGVCGMSQADYQLELPKDVEELYAITYDVMLAGVPQETDEMRLIHRMHDHAFK